MIMKLIFHIGWSKSGSTSIQTCIHKNYKEFLAKGILIPKTGKHLSRHFDFFRLDGENFSNLLKSLAKEAKDKKCHTVILSDESINKLKDYSKYEEFKKYFNEIKIVAFLRRQDLLMESYYNQMLKVPWDSRESTFTLEEALDHFEKLHWFNFDIVLDEFAAMFGYNNIIVQPFEREQINMNLVEKFLSLVGVPIKGIDTSQDHFNEAVPYSALNALRIINSFDMSICGDRGKPRKAVHELLRSCWRDHSKLIIPYERRQSIMDSYSYGNMKVSEKYLKKSDLFISSFPSKGDPVQKIDNVTLEDVVSKVLIPALKKVVIEE